MGLLYLSLHFCYASHPWYSPIYLTGWRNGKKRYAQVVVAVKIKPGTYKKKKETEGGAKKPFDDYSIIPEDEIEWYSKRRGCVLPYGLLVRNFWKNLEGGNWKNRLFLGIYKNHI